MKVPTVVMMRKKTARPTAKKASGKAPQPSLIHAGYTYPKQCIYELLELAGAENSAQSRRDLLNALQLAQMSYEDEVGTSSRQRPPSKQIEQFEKSLEKTGALLRHIRRYDDFRNVGFVTQQIGRGVVAVGPEELPRNPSISDQELVFPKFDGRVATMNIEPLLRATLLAARKRRRGRGGPKNLGKESVVFYAEQYFRRHSPKEPSTNPTNPFHPFVDRFYEVVTKTEPRGLDRQIRKVLAARRSGQ